MIDLVDIRKAFSAGKLVEFSWTQKPTPYGCGHVGLATPVPYRVGLKAAYCYTFLRVVAATSKGMRKQ
jgi:hypothetical protein